MGKKDFQDIEPLWYSAMRRDNKHRSFSMQIKLLKISVSIKKIDRFFVDFEFPELRIILKGIRYNRNTHRAFLPFVVTEDKGVYSPFCFMDSETMKEVISTMLSLIKEEKLPELTEGQREYIKRIREEEVQRRKRKLRGHVGRAPSKPKEDKGANKALQANSKKETPATVRPCPDPKGGRENAFLSTFGAGFTEIPLPRRKP
jgi:hypothetical protein